MALPSSGILACACAFAALHQFRAWEFQLVVLPSYVIHPEISSYMETVETDNMGFCSTRCSVNNACTSANYIRSKKLCQLSSAANWIWSYQPDSAVLLKLQSSSTSQTSQYQRINGSLINGTDGLINLQASYAFQRVATISLCQKICESMNEACFAFSFHTINLTCVTLCGNFNEGKLSVNMADSNWTGSYRHNQLSAIADATYRQVTGVLIKSGQIEKNVSYTFSDVPSAASCQRICELLTSNCSVFAHHTTLLVCTISNIDFYDDWTSMHSSDPRWNSYYKIRTSGLKLLLKVGKEIGIDVSNVWTLPEHANLTASVTDVALNSDCNCFVKSQVAELENVFNITAVRLVMASEGKETKFLKLNATGTTLRSVFVPNRILNSSWSDLSATASIGVMSMRNSTDNFYGRYFLLQKTGFIGCDIATSWMMIHGKLGEYVCPFEHDPVPRFVYSNLSTASCLNIRTAYADAFLIYASL